MKFCGFTVIVSIVLNAVPEGISAPFVSGGAGGQPVLVVWTTPLSPNGIVTSYVVERQTGANDSSLVTIATLPGSAIALVAGDQTTRPFTEYSYRVTAANSAGEVRSEFTAFLTPEAGEYSSFHMLLNILCCVYWKFMVCMGHRLQCKTPHFIKHKFPTCATPVYSMGLLFLYFC